MLSRDPTRKSYRPLVAALTLEFIARWLRRAPSPTSTLERSEYSRRDMEIFWYTLRGCVWETWTR